MPTPADEHMLHRLSRRLPLPPAAEFRLYCSTSSLVDGWGQAWLNSSAPELLKPVSVSYVTSNTIVHAPSQLMSVYQRECTYRTGITLKIPGARHWRPSPY
jgi:hypothetical protein